MSEQNNNEEVELDLNKLKQVRKDIARAKTVIREREIAAQA